MLIDGGAINGGKSPKGKEVVFLKIEPSMEVKVPKGRRWFFSKSVNCRVLPSSTRPFSCKGVVQVLRKMTPILPTLWLESRYKEIFSLPLLGQNVQIKIPCLQVAIATTRFLPNLLTINFVETMVGEAVNPPQSTI